MPHNYTIYLTNPVTNKIASKLNQLGYLCALVTEFLAKQWVNNKHISFFTKKLYIGGLLFPQLVPHPQHAFPPSAL